MNTDIDGVSSGRLCINWYSELLAKGLKLAYCRGTLHVSGYQERTLPLFTKIVGKLGGSGRFTGALQSNKHYHIWRRSTKVESILSLGTAQHFYQFLIDDSQNLLCGREAAQYIGANGLLFNALNEMAHHFEIYICFE